MTIADQHSTAVALHTLVNDPILRPTGHVAATTALIVTWLGVFNVVLATVGTLMAILWYGVAIYESNTMQTFLARRAARKLVGAKVTAQNDAASGLAVAKDAVKQANALPPDAPKKV
ncbi:MAG: hypothetical protein RB191_12520 [Terriglobia bacterium]|nr:hypothetical protein [Terriglobia bacterium]